MENEVTEQVRKKLSFLDRYLTLWIFSGNVHWRVWGNISPGVVEFGISFNRGQNIPIAIGPYSHDVSTACKGQNEELGEVLRLESIQRSPYTELGCWANPHVYTAVSF